MRMTRKLAAVGILAAMTGLAGCGSGSGGGGGSHVANSVTMSVNAGPLPNTNPATNSAFVDVEVCVPGTSNCQTIHNVSVDTGSSGLRILASQLTLPLAQENGSDGNPLVECAKFVSFVTWGPMKMADIKMAGEVASNVPIQVIGDPAFGTIPGSCSSNGVPVPAQNQAALAANGLLGVGLFMQDCGGGCSVTLNNPGFYYSCPMGSPCAVTNATATQQAQNPVWMFPQDNNGVLMQLPQIGATGAPTVQGTLIFGIGTQSNNGLGSATVLTTTATDGSFTTTFKGTPYPGSFIDSGSNGIFFLTTNETLLPNCTSSVGFYCPTNPSTVNFSATNRGTNNASNTVNFSIIDVDDPALAPSNNFAFNDIGGPNPGAFDWGLPFFFGRNVFTAIELQQTPGGVGPYFAY